MVRKNFELKLRKDDSNYDPFRKNKLDLDLGFTRILFSSDDYELEDNSKVWLKGPLEDNPSGGEDHSDNTPKKVRKYSKLTINWMDDYYTDVDLFKGPGAMKVKKMKKKI